MLSLSSAQRYFIYSDLADMRKGFDSLSGLVRSEFKMNPLSGDVFIFLSRTRNKIKLLQWERDGFAIYYKRLEKGRFELPEKMEGKSMPISSQKLMLIMEGIKLSSIKKHKRYEQYCV